MPPPKSSANISRKLTRTCSKVSAKSFCVVLLIFAMTSSNSFFDAGEVVVLLFEETVALLEFVVLLDGVEIDRPHVVELAGQIGDDRFELGCIDFSGGRRRSSRASASEPRPEASSSASSTRGVTARFNCTRSVFWKP